MRIPSTFPPCSSSPPDSAQTVERALRDNNLNPELFEVEITETVILKDKEEVRKNLAAMKEMGVMTTIDDFGTGYSSID